MSAQRGNAARWLRDGKRFTTAPPAHHRGDEGSGPAFSVTDRRPVAEDHFAFENTINYDTTPDGRRVVLVPVDEGLQLNVIVNWAEELAKRTSTSPTAR